MKIIFLSRFCHKSGSRALSLPKFAAVSVLILSGLLGAAGWAGYQWGAQSVAGSETASNMVTEEALRQLLAQQRDELEAARDQTRDHLDALALKLGAMQSHVLRLDALGERLALAGKLDPEEFDFAAQPPQGGLEPLGLTETVTASELALEIEQLSRTLDDREHKLLLMEELMQGSKLFDELKISGRPIKKGWVSSRYGYRKDPFTGKKAFHHGVDLAGKNGADVISVAAGVVIEAEKKTGYGYTIEVRHADGYVTRYAHLKEILVAVGDMVNKQQVIAKMGSTGRSTGPHVHFEVAKNGRSINPQRYLRAK